jgi:hypothetical protein
MSKRNLCSHLTVHIIGPVIVDHVLSIQPQSRIRIGKHSWGGLAGATIPCRKIVSIVCINSIYGLLHTVSCHHVMRTAQFDLTDFYISNPLTLINNYIWNKARIV